MEKNIRDSDQDFNSMSGDFAWIEIKPYNEELQKAKILVHHLQGQKSLRNTTNSSQQKTQTTSVRPA